MIIVIGIIIMIIRRVRVRTHCGQSGERLCDSGMSVAGGGSLRSDDQMMRMVPENDGGDDDKDADKDDLRYL